MHWHVSVYQNEITFAGNGNNKEPWQPKKYLNTKFAEGIRAVYLVPHKDKRIKRTGASDRVIVQQNIQKCPPPETVDSAGLRVIMRCSGSTIGLVTASKGTVII